MKKIVRTLYPRRADVSHPAPCAASSATPDGVPPPSHPDASATRTHSSHSSSHSIALAVQSPGWLTRTTSPTWVVPLHSSDSSEDPHQARRSLNL